MSSICFTWFKLTTAANKVIIPLDVENRDPALAGTAAEAAVQAFLPKAKTLAQGGVCRWHTSTADRGGAETRNSLPPSI